MAEWGRLFGIGIGPGDSGLLTVKAVETLNEVDVIFSPRSAPKKESIARKIIEPVLKGSPDIRELVFPMTKDKRQLEEHWLQAAEEVAVTLKEGKNAAFITLGDPLFYSTYIYLYEKLKARYPEAEIITIPGVSSPFAAASAAGVPIAVGDEKVAILPLPQVIGEIWHYLEEFETVIILKVGERLRGLVSVLSGLGLLDSAILVQKVSLEGAEKIVFGLSHLPEDELSQAGYLSTVIVKREMVF